MMMAECSVYYEVYTREVSAAMKVTAKELRIQPGRIIDYVAEGQEVTVTYRGRALAKIVPMEEGGRGKADAKDGQGIFGMWCARADAETVDEAVRRLREGRQF